MRKDNRFRPGLATIAAVCAAIDVCALMAIAMAPNTASVCGGSWVLPGVGMIVIATYGVPLVVAGAIGVVLSARLPFFRSPRPWMFWSLALCGLAAMMVIGAGAAHPEGTEPIRCVL